MKVKAGQIVMYKPKGGYGPKPGIITSTELNQITITVFDVVTEMHVLADMAAQVAGPDNIEAGQWWLRDEK